MYLNCEAQLGQKKKKSCTSETSGNLTGIVPMRVKNIYIEPHSQFRDISFQNQLSNSMRFISYNFGEIQKSVARNQTFLRAVHKMQHLHSNKNHQLAITVGNVFLVFKSDETKVKLFAHNQTKTDCIQGKSPTSRPTIQC